MGDAPVTPAEPEAPAQSFLERLMGVFISPSETFADVARKPGFWAPLIASVIGSVAVIETMLWKIGAERITRYNIEQSSRAASMSPEQIDQAVSQAAKITAFSYHIGGVLGTPIALLVIAGLGILITNVIFGGGAKFKTVFSEICYAQLVQLLGGVMAIALIVFGDPDHFNPQNFVPSNIGFFLNPHDVSKPLYSLAQSIDIFSIWLLILYGISLSKATGEKVKAMSISLVYAGIWLLYVLAKVGLSTVF